MSEIPEAVGSKAWLSVSLKTVQEFLGMCYLDIEEAALVRALIRWGKFQLQEDGDDPNDGQKLRGKILPGIHLIRFAAVSHFEFVQLCLDGLEEVLSGDEKHSIMMFIVTNDWKHMLKQIAPTKLAPRQKPYTVFHLKTKSPALQKQSGSTITNFENYSKVTTSTLSFQLDKNATFAGLAVEGPPSFLKNLSINLQGSQAGISKGIFSLVGKEFFKINSEVELTGNTWYNLVFASTSPPTCTFSIPNYYRPFTSDGLSLKICTPTISVNLQKIMFRPYKNLAT
jgi:hypothetical protein